MEYEVGMKHLPVIKEMFVKRKEILEQTKSTVDALIKNYKNSENLHSLKTADKLKELIILLDMQVRGDGLKVG